MLALVAGFLLVGYLLAPGAIFRFCFSLFLPAKRFQRSRTEEVLFSSIATLTPFVFCLALLHTPVGRYPRWHVGGDKQTAYRRTADSLIGSATVPPRESADAFIRSFLEQGRFVLCLWLACAVEGCVLGALVASYGDLKPEGWRRRLCNKFLLKQVSEWHVLFSRMALASNDPRTQVAIDVLTSQNMLYRGLLVDWFLDPDGKLAGIFLESAERFNRADRDRDRDEGKHLPADQYWLPIPGAKLYLTAASLTNYNIRYVEPVSAREQEAVAEAIGEGATLTPLLEDE